MKKSVLYETIDGYDVIRGFDNMPAIDPVETERAVKAVIDDTPEYQALIAKQGEYSEAAQKMITAYKSKDEKSYNDAKAHMKVRQDEIIPLAEDAKVKLKAMRQDNAVYFEPRAGEVLRDASEVETLAEAIKTCPDGALTLLDGSTVEDNRGEIYFRKVSGRWMRTVIIKLGDKIPGDATKNSAVNDIIALEIEKDRVAALSDAARTAEKEKAMADVIASAAGMRSRLEIQSDPDALTKSRDWYDAEVALIEALYG